MYKTVGFIGTGNMGSAIAKAAVKSGIPEKLLLANRTPAKAEVLARELGNAEAVDNKTVAEVCNIIFLAVKPQFLGEVMEEIAPVLAKRNDRFVLATMAAGQSCEKIKRLAGGAYPVIRMMPNTPAGIGAGVVQYCGDGASAEELEEFAKLIAPAGLVDPIAERLIDAASAVSGCGPAFVYMMIEALADGGVACGLPRDKALNYAAKMVEGSAKLVLESGKHPGALKDAVCSPGGTTIQGVRTLEREGFRGAAIDAVIAAYDKTMELK